MNNDKLFIFSAPSGSGKTTIVKYLLKELKNYLEFSISATSREPRKGEVNGKDYYFFSKEKFEDLIKSGTFLEWEEVYNGNYYGTLLSEVKRIWDKKKSLIFDIDVIGALNIKRKYPNETVTIFVDAGSYKELKKRLMERNTENKKSLNIRLSKAKEELSYKEKFDEVLLNENLEEAKKNAKILILKYFSK